MKVKLDDGARTPTRSHPTDAGLDLYARQDKRVPAHGSALFDTGVHIELPHNTVGMLRSKSGLNTRHGITTTGTIDEGFSGSIVVNVQNHSDNDYFVQKGDKITQLLVVPCLYVDVVLTDEIKGGERGANGFGSTGK